MKEQNVTSAPDMPAALDALLDGKQTATYLHTTEAKLRQDRYLGRGPKYVKNGARVLYRATDLKAYLEDNVRG